MSESHQGSGSSLENQGNRLERMFSGREFALFQPPESASHLLTTGTNNLPVV